MTTLNGPSYEGSSFPSTDRYFVKGMLRFISVAIVLWLSGCTVLNELHQRHQGNEGSPYYRVPVDSKLVLNQAVIVPAKKRRVYFQYGRPLAFWEVNEYRPWCVLRMRTKKDVAQKITPDEFVVRSVSREPLYEIARLPVQVAQFGSDGTDFTYEVVATRLELYSDTQPNVQTLSCSKWGVQQDRFHVTIRSIRETLGDIFDLQLAN